MKTTIHLNTYIDEYIDLMTLRAQDHEMRLREAVAKMATLPALDKEAISYKTTSRPFYESRTEAQFVQDDARSLHDYRGRLYQAIWQAGLGNKEFCLCHSEVSEEGEETGRKIGWDYDLLLEPFGQYYDHWRVVLDGEHGRERRCFLPTQKRKSAFCAGWKSCPPGIYEKRAASSITTRPLFSHAPGCAAPCLFVVAHLTT